MTTPFPFVSAAVLTAAQMNAITTLPITAKTASATLTAAESVGYRVTMSSASATTITINSAVYAAGDTIFIANIGAGTTTLTAGSGVTLSTAGSLAIVANQGGFLVMTSATAGTFYPSAVTAASAALTLINSTTIGSAVTSVAVTGVFSSTYDNYLIVIGGGGGTAGTVGLRFGSTATGYFGGGLYIGLAGAVTGFGNNNTTSFNNILLQTATNGYGIAIQVQSPNLAKHTVIQVTGASDAAGHYFAGALSNTTAYTDFTLLASSGNLTGGTIKTYGYANS